MRTGLPITVETCTHYLVFAAESVPEGATWFKCAPPLRSKANQDKLWAAVKAGKIDGVASDHSPCPPDMKELESGNFMKAWGGIAGNIFISTRSLNQCMLKSPRLLCTSVPDNLLLSYCMTVLQHSMLPASCSGTAKHIGVLQSD